jgi:hypothetical protein
LEGIKATSFFRGDTHGRTDGRDQEGMYTVHALKGVIENYNLKKKRKKNFFRLEGIKATSFFR